ncbi:MAG: hypothetical protein N2Z22_01825 [Turneriella sp.]|nr:hypothetical protein [Turneriella sp.]
MQRLLIPLAFCGFFVFFACGKKKESQREKVASTEAPKVGYALYATGLFPDKDAKKASEWLSRAEMVYILEEINVPDSKDPKKTKKWLKIKRTTDSQGYVDPDHIIVGQAFAVKTPLHVYSVNQAVGNKRGTVMPGQVGFIVKEVAGWAQVKFGYKVYQDYNDLSKLAWVDDGWAQLEDVSKEPEWISKAAEFEAAVRNYANSDASKKEKGRQQLESIAKSESPFASQASMILGQQHSEQPARSEQSSQTQSQESQ